LLASTALPHFAPLGRVTPMLKLIQILGFVPWLLVTAGHQPMLTVLGGLAEFEQHPH
jgi:hypothetical protein